VHEVEEVMADSVQEGAEEEDNTPCENEEMRQSCIKLAETPVFFVRTKELAVKKSIDYRCPAKDADALAETDITNGRLADTPPAGVPDDGIDQDYYSNRGKYIHNPGILNVPENLTGRAHFKPSF
jgi:hypothetical protein